MVFHPFDVVIDRAIVDAEQLQEVGQDLVTASDVARERFPRGG
jgi:hypothetical protein